MESFLISINTNTTITILYLLCWLQTLSCNNSNNGNNGNNGHSNNSNNVEFPVTVHMLGVFILTLFILNGGKLSRVQGHSGLWCFFIIYIFVYKKKQLLYTKSFLYLIFFIFMTLLFKIILNFFFNYMKLLLLLYETFLFLYMKLF